MSPLLPWSISSLCSLLRTCLLNTQVSTTIFCLPIVLSSKKVFHEKVANLANNTDNCTSVFLSYFGIWKSASHIPILTCRIFWRVYLSFVFKKIITLRASSRIRCSETARVIFPVNVGQWRKQWEVGPFGATALTYVKAPALLPSCDFDISMQMKHSEKVK